MRGVHDGCLTDRYPIPLSLSVLNADFSIIRVCGMLLRGSFAYCSLDLTTLVGFLALDAAQGPQFPPGLLRPSERVARPEFRRY